jgi:hypothetical protein
MVIMKFLRKNGLKFLLDIVMAIVLALMYNKRVLGLSFHEIGGLALCGLFVIHKLLNRQWIKAVTPGLFSRRTPVRQRVYWVLDLLLLVCFAVILITGINISKVVFPGSEGTMQQKVLHYAAAALALALAGVHLGLHMGRIGQRIGFLQKWPVALKRTLAVALSAGVVAVGSYAVASTSYLNWIGNLGTLSSSGSFPTQENRDADADTDSDDDSDAVSDVAAAIAAVETAESDATAATETQSGGGNGNGLHDGLGPHGNGNGNGGGQAATGNLGEVLLNFLGIFLGFAAVTAWIDGWLKARKRRRLRSATATVA